MIVAEQKPIDEIKEMVTPYRKLLVLGCGTCVKTCFAGGEDEVAALVSAGGILRVLAGQPAEVLAVGRPLSNGIGEPAKAIDLGFGVRRNGDEDLGRLDARERLIAFVGGAHRRVRRVDCCHDQAIVQVARSSSPGRLSLPKRPTARPPTTTPRRHE